MNHGKHEDEFVRDPEGDISSSSAASAKRVGGRSYLPSGRRLAA
jgi:hypothetical protein